MANDDLDRRQEQPTTSAMMRIKVGPDGWGGSVDGVVPNGQAHHFISTLGIMGSTWAGLLAAAYSTQHSSAVALPLAELGTGLLASLLIAICGRAKRPVSAIPAEPGDPAAPEVPAGPAVPTAQQADHRGRAVRQHRRSRTGLAS